MGRANRAKIKRFEFGQISLTIPEQQGVIVAREVLGVLASHSKGNCPALTFQAHGARRTEDGLKQQRQLLDGQTGVKGNELAIAPVGDPDAARRHRCWQALLAAFSRAGGAKGGCPQDFEGLCSRVSGAGGASFFFTSSLDVESGA